MSRKKVVPRNFVIILGIICIILSFDFIGTITNFSTRVFAFSTVSYSTEETFYFMIAHHVYEVFRYKAYISIETELDGSWENNTQYNVEVYFKLLWYNESFCPHGIKIECAPWFYIYRDGDGVLQYVNLTREPQPFTITDYYEHYVWRFEIQTSSFPSKITAQIDSGIEFSVFNGSSTFRNLDWGAIYLYGHFKAPSTYIICKQSEISIQNELQNLQRDVNSLEVELNNIRNSMYVLILTTIILIATTVYSAIRKTK